MKVVLAESAGFCKGVEDAIKITLEQASTGKNVSTLGRLVHNEEVIEHLDQNRVGLYNNVADILGGTVIIRTHGEGPTVHAELKKREDLEIIDATCPHVKKVQHLAKSYAENGYQVVIFGDIHHPEVKALIEWAGPQALIATPETDTEHPHLNLSLKAVLISQTTQQEDNFAEFAQELKAKNPQLEVHNTICRATAQRQKAALKLANTVDLMLVVGDEQSSNTRKLTQACREITKTYQVTGAREIFREWLVGAKTVGVTAGASTPHWKIKEVMVMMENGSFEEKAAEEFSPSQEEHNQEEVSQEELGQEEIKEYMPGDVVTGKVVLVDEEQVLVDIGAKSEAVLPRKEVYLEGDNTLDEIFSRGDSVDVLVLKANDQEDRTVVSQKRLERERRWKELEDALEDTSNLSGNVKEVVPAGIIIDLKSGIEGFMPGSLVDLRYIPDFQEFLGQEFSFKVVELNRERDKVILSRKQALEEEQEQHKQETINNLTEGQIISGVIKRLTDFGAFVDVGGIDGLVHISEVSWQRVGHPREILKVGEEVQVKVLEIIPERERISLSIRQAQPDPWSQLEERLQVGAVVKGKVTRIVNFGAFVEIIPGVEGLVHISQMADFHVKHPSEVLQEGEEVEVKILDINKEGKRISLSIKEARPAPKDYSASAQQKDQETQNVTLGDIFGDLFPNNVKNELQDAEDEEDDNGKNE